MRILASSNRLSENIHIRAIIVAKLKFRDIQREVLGANFMERADHAALHQRPEAFDGLGMNRTADVLTARVIHDAMRKLAVQVFVTDPLVGAEQTDFRGDAFADEGFEGCRANIRDHASDYVSFALNRARDDGFTHSARPAVTATALVFVPVFGFAAHESFVNLNHTHELAEIFVREARTDAHAHGPSRAVRAETKHPVNLKGAHALFGREHEVDDPKPVAQGFVGVLEDCAGDVAETVVGARRRTFVAQPIPSPRAVFTDLCIAATGASHALRPAVSYEVGATGVLGGESLFPLSEGHLVYLLFHSPESRHV